MSDGSYRALLVSGPVLVLVVVAIVAAGLSRVGSAGPAGPVEPSGPSARPPVDLVALREELGVEECPPSDAGVPARGDGLPDVTVPCIDGSTQVRLAGLRGRPLIVNVWATWCGSCREEAPLLAQFAEDNPGANLLGIDVSDPDTEGALRFAGASRWTWPQLADVPGVTRAHLPAGIPQTLFVTADGRVAYQKFGPFTSVDELTALADEHLGGS